MLLWLCAQAKMMQLNESTYWSYVLYVILIILLINPTLWEFVEKFIQEGIQFYSNIILNITDNVTVFFFPTTYGGGGGVLGGSSSSTFGGKGTFILVDPSE